MSATIEQLNELRNTHHANCFVCGNPGMGLEFTVCNDGKATAEVDCRNIHQGYDGILHGGIIASLLDGAMVNCLFAHGIAAMTAELKVRYRRPVAVNRRVRLIAWICRDTFRLYRLKSQLIQDDAVMAEASGKFMKKPHYE